MSIPVHFTQPIYTFKIPSTGTEIKFRPYLVKEEKILLTALEADDFKQILNAIEAIIHNCTFGELDPKTLTTYDLELLFLNLRGRSQGEEIKINVVSNNCKLKGGEGECDKPTEISVKIADIKCLLQNKDTKAFEPFEGKENFRVKQLELDEENGVVMKHPSFEEFSVGHKLFDAADKPPKASWNQLQMELVANCMVSIWHKEEIYQMSEHSLAERIAWLSELDKRRMGIIEDFFDTIPKVRHSCKFICGECGMEDDYIIEGLRHFFALG